MRADTVLLKPTKEEQELGRVALHTSLLWNEANYQRRQAFLDKKKTPRYSEQCKHFKHSDNFEAANRKKSGRLEKTA